MVVDFTNLRLDDKSPIYMQIVRYVKICIVSGQIKNEDELPSRRILSAMLEVNPNTIQKAYCMLEVEGLIVSFAGSKSIFQLEEWQRVEIQKQLLKEETVHFVEMMKQMGITLEEVQQFISQMWEGGV